LALAACLGLVACGAPASEVQQIREEIKALKAEMVKLEDKLGQIHTDQQQVLSLLAKQSPGPENQAFSPEEGGLTVDQLLQTPSRYLGSQVTVKGQLALVLIHRKSFFLKGPQEQVLVYFGNLTDNDTVQRLTSQDWPGEIVVTGTLMPSDQIRAGYQIVAEAIKFQ